MLLSRACFSLAQSPLTGLCGRVIQSSGPLRYGIVEGMDVSGEPCAQLSAPLECRAEPRPAGSPAQSGGQCSGDHGRFGHPKSEKGQKPDFR
jgi:hypothetical protein